MHRGPDGKGAWLSPTPSLGTIALGHRRLSIIDLSTAAAQPMFYADGRYAIVFNGEIYNYLEIRAELSSLGANFRTESDTEVLLAAYAQWGSEFLSKLNGMFAFTIWDRKLGLLFVARDRFGEKPLYAAQLACGGIAFASEAKALFAHPDVSAQIDLEAVNDFLGGGALIAGSRTLFKQVVRFPAASAAIYDADGKQLQCWRYWTPDFTNIDRSISSRDAADEFGLRLRRSLKLRLRSDVQVGACLSGGLDSSTLVGMLAKMESEKGQILRHTYSARFDDDPTMSEGPFIDKVLNYTGVDRHFITPSADQFVADARRLYWHQEIPFLSSSVYLEWCVLRLARETGTTVMIDGQGADELLGGYPQFFKLRQLDLAQTLRLKSLFAETRSYADRLARAKILYADSERRFSAKSAYTISDIAEMEARRHLAGLRNSITRRTPSSGAPVRSGVPDRSGYFRTNLANSLLYDSLPMQLHSADRTAMAHGVETRFPFLDYELVDWTIGLPDDALTEDGWQKIILRRAAAGFIPDDVRWRADKVGYAAPQDRWMAGGMRDWMEDRLSSPQLAEFPAFDKQSSQAAFADIVEGRSTDSWSLFRWASTAEWLEFAAQGIWRSGIQSGADSAPEMDVEPLPC